MPARRPFLRAADTGVLRGDGIFERFLVIGGQPRHLEDHLARMARSAESVDSMRPPPAPGERQPPSL